VFSFVFRVDRRYAKDCCAAGTRFGDYALDLFGGNERTDGVMHQNYFRGGVHLRERIGNRVLARITTMNYSRGSAERGFGDFVLQGHDVVGTRGDKKIGDIRTSGEAPQSKNHERHAVEFEELLWRFGAHAGAEPGSGNNGSNSGHRRVNSLSQLSTKVEKTVVGQFSAIRLTRIARMLIGEIGRASC